VSRITGVLTSIPIPQSMRSTIFGAFDAVYPCHLEEYEPLQTYGTFQEFFTRTLNSRASRERQEVIENSRKIADLVSPADGSVYAIGELNLDVRLSDVRLDQSCTKHDQDIVGVLGNLKGSNESCLTKNVKLGQGSVLKGEKQIDLIVGDFPAGADQATNSSELIGVKGLKIPLPELLDLSPSELRSMIPGVIEASNGERALYYCSVYLNPGSYHRFHSPVDGLRVSTERRITGDLLPVATWFMRLIPCVPAINERVAIIGTWARGFFSIVPVGATNVGSVIINDRQSSKVDGRSEQQVARMGDELGRFEMGSLVVMIFEGPKGVRWLVSPNDPIRYGEPMASFT